MRKLSPRQEAFCMAYAKCGNATQAYREAGYKVKSERAAVSAGSRMLTNVDIQRRLEEIRAQVESERIVEPRAAQEWLSSIIRGEVRVDGKETQVKDRLRAMELLGKMQGLFIDRKEVSMTGAVPVVLVDDVKD